jgi:hypothetical protein
MQEMLQKFLLYYYGFESRPVFDSVEEMLKWSGLYGLTQRTLEEDLAHYKPNRLVDIRAGNCNLLLEDEDFC